MLDSSIFLNFRASMHTARGCEVNIGVWSDNHHLFALPGESPNRDQALRAFTNFRFMLGMNDLDETVGYSTNWRRTGDPLGRRHGAICAFGTTQASLSVRWVQGGIRYYGKRLQKPPTPISPKCVSAPRTRSDRYLCCSAHLG